MIVRICVHVVQKLCISLGLLITHKVSKLFIERQDDLMKDVVTSKYASP